MEKKAPIPNESALMIGLERHAQMTGEIEALIERLRKDLADYRARNQKMTPGQKIHVEIREKLIADLCAYMELTDALTEGLVRLISHMRQEPARLNARIRNLEKENEKMKVILQRGYGYNISLLPWQKTSDFY